jgi:hypothetical protein
MAVFEPHDDPKIEYRPLSDTIRPDGFGAPLRLPTMPNPKTGLRYPMLDADDRPLPRALDAMMLAIDFTPAWVVESLAASWRVEPKRLSRDFYPPRCIRPNDDSESASDILRSLWGVHDAQPGRVFSCPAVGFHSHGDVHKGLSILADDQRAICHKPGCDLNNDGRGRGTHELRKMAPGAAL